MQGHAPEGTTVGWVEEGVLPSTMQIRFDVITEEHRYPLARDQVKRVLLEAFKEAPELREAVRSVRFGCSRHTTQEGRVVQRGQSFEVRINFCLRENRTRALSASRSWLDAVTACGGVHDSSSGQVVWSKAAAAKYAAFLLFHEVAHLVYMRRSGATALGFNSGAREEERFCDEWAMGTLTRWQGPVASGPDRE